MKIKGVYHEKRNQYYRKAEKASKVNAPRIKECFLNIECELLWEHDLFEGSGEATVALRAVNICMDDEHYDQSKLGRYGKSGFLFQVDQPTNPETGETDHYHFFFPMFRRVQTD